MTNKRFLFSGKGNSMPRARARYIAQAIQLEEQPPSGVISAAMFITLVFLLAAAAWASVTVINETAHTTGEVVPAGLNQNVQHLEGGLVKELPVRNGDRVKAGQLLLRLDPTSVQSELEQMQAREAALSLQGERLAALIEQRQPDFGELGERYPALAAKQRTIYQAQLNSFQREMQVIDSQIAQREKELVRQRNDVQSARREVALLQEQVKLRRGLAEKKLVSRSELLATQSQLAESEGALRRALDGVAVAESSLDEAKQRRIEAEAKYFKDIELEAGGLAAELAEVTQTLVRLQDKLRRLDIYSPINGIVQGLSVTNRHAVVEPGELIMQIVPIDDELIVESRLSPSDVGYVHEGQSADVKIDSFDSSLFGSVPGSVRRISASTYLDEKRQPYYRVEIALSRDFVGDPAQQLRIIPGMTVRADIKTGSKSILQYLMKPITRGFSGAFKER